MPCGQALLACELGRGEDGDAVAGCNHAVNENVRSTPRRIR
jgi:hypothetical protein